MATNYTNYTNPGGKSLGNREPGSDLPWRIERRSGSGEFLCSHRGALLGRLDRASGCLWLWDKRLGGEVPVKLSDLLAMCAQA